MKTTKRHKHVSIALSTVPITQFGIPLLLFVPSGGELFIIFFAVVLLFGGQKIPELMRGIGRGIREFNDARDGLKKTLEESIRQADRDAEERKRLAEKKADEGD